MEANVPNVLIILKENIGIYVDVQVTLKYLNNIYNYNYLYNFLKYLR